MFWKPPEMWADQTVYIIGGGPSVLRTALHRIHDRPVIGTNNAFTLGPWVDVTFFGDRKWWDDHGMDLLRHPGMIITCLPNAPFTSLSRVKQLKMERRRLGIWTKTRDTICWNQNSGAAAINLAILLGAARVVLLGFDFKTDKERGLREGHSWHEFHTSIPQQDIYTNKFLKSMKCIKKDLVQLNESGTWPRQVEVLNATPDSALKEFPMVSLEETLE